MSRALLALALSAALTACSRPQPSPDYDRAHQLWTALVQARGDDAAEDPQADEVLDLLSRVPKDSLDAAAAAELRGRIEGERTARADERARRDRLAAAAGTPPSMPSAGPGSAPATPRPAPPALARGMKLEDFRAAYGDCFEPKGEVQVGSPDGGAPRAGQQWQLKDDEGCRARYAQLAGQAVLFVADALEGVSPLASARKVEIARQVELGRLPDGGIGLRVDGGVLPLPPGARLVPADGGVRP